MATLHGLGLHLVSDRERKRRELYSDGGPIPPKLFRYREEDSTLEFDTDAIQTDNDLGQNFLFARMRKAIRLHEYQWRFGRADVKDLPDRAGLAALGEAMTAQVDAESERSNIPVGYTYLGQFIAHDLTFAQEPKGEGDPKSLRTPALDLDSLYDRPFNKGDEAGCPASTGNMLLGCTTAGRAEDLPRAADGRPVIGDIRNDDNLALAQTHVALLKFHNAVAAVLDRDEPGYRDSRLRRIVRQHFQSVVLHDYLKRVIHSDTYSDVLTNGRSIIYPNGLEKGERFRLPIEFAAAAFRFGHSMIRHNYDQWNGIENGSLGLFWDNTFNSKIPPITRLKDKWVNKWERLLCFRGTRLEKQQTSPPLMAAPINTRLAPLLGRIPDVVLPEVVNSYAQVSNNLASRTLLRGHTLRLKSADSVIASINSELPRRVPRIPTLSDDALLASEHEWVDYSFERRFGYAHAIKSRAPLWFYILKEAEALGSAGNCLGPLGSRIVMEVLHAAIQFSKDAIIDDKQKVDWRPDPRLCPSTSTEFTFPDMIAFAS